MGGHCAAYYHAFIKKGAEACGVAPSMLESIRQFVPFVEDLAKEYELDEDLIYQNLQVCAAKPIMKLKKSNQNRKAAEKHIIETIKSEKSPTVKTIEDALGVEHHPKMMADPDAIKKEISQKIILTTKPGSDIAEKNRVFSLVLGSPGYIQSWRDFAERKGLENEYAALMYITVNLKQL